MQQQSCCGCCCQSCSTLSSSKQQQQQQKQQQQQRLNRQWVVAISLSLERQPACEYFCCRPASFFSSPFYGFISAACTSNVYVYIYNKNIINNISGINIINNMNYTKYIQVLHEKTNNNN